MNEQIVNEKLLYEDGVELSLGKAYTFIQNIANNRIRNFTRVITQSPGFLDDSFKIDGMERDLSQISTYYLKMKAGGVVFPNGEVFSGDGFECRIPIQKNPAIQYVKIKHVTLYQTKQDQSFGEDGYANTTDGVEIVVSTSPDLADDGTELLTSEVNYFPDFISPVSGDRRDSWVFFWSPSSVIDPSEILSFDIEDISIRSTKGMRDPGHVNIIDSPDMNSEYSTIVTIPVFSGVAQYAWDSLIESSTPEVKGMFRDIAPHTDVARDPVVMFRLPDGLSARIRFKRNDAYRLGITTEWADSEEEVEIRTHEHNNDAFFIEFLPHSTQALLGVKAYTTEDIDSSGHVKLWLSSEEKIDSSSPPNYILPLPSTQDSGDQLPYIVLHYDINAESIYYSYQFLVDGFKIVQGGSGSIAGVAEWGDEEVFEIPMGADRLNASGSVISADDEDGQIIYYDAPRVGEFYIPLSTASWGEKRYLKLIEVINYAPYPTWSASSLTATKYPSDETWIDVGSDEPPVDSTDSIAISNTSNAAILADGTYTVSYKFLSGGTWYIVVPGLPAGAPGTVTCDVTERASNPSPRADIEIFKETRNSESYVYTVQLGQDRDVHFPDSRYYDSQSFTGDECELEEGYRYTIKATRDTGGYNDRMNMQGSIKLTFAKKMG